MRHEREETREQRNQKSVAAFLVAFAGDVAFEKPGEEPADIIGVAADVAASRMSRARAVE